MIADLCNGLVFVIDMENEAKQSYVESFKLFNYLLNLVGNNKGYLVGCMK